MSKFVNALPSALVSVICFMLLATQPCLSQSQSVPFCDDFEDGSGFLTRWTSVMGSQTPVPSPVYSGAAALKFRGVDGNCHTGMYCTDFEACTGEYSAWVNQQHFEAGFAIFIQVQPGTSPNPHLREGYRLSLHAQNAQGGGVFHVYRLNDGGTGSLLGSKTPQFDLGEWIRVFIRRLPGNMLVAGYERNGVVDSMVVVDPNPPIANPGAFYLWSCSDGPPTDNFFDLACYSPLPCSDGPICFDRGADVNCDGVWDVLDVLACINIVFNNGSVKPCPAKP